MWRSHPSRIRSWSVLITFKSSESSKEVHPGSTEVFAKLLFVAIASIECCTLSFLVLPPITINSLDHWTSYAAVSRPYDTVTPLRHLFPQLCSQRQDLTDWPCWVPCCPYHIPGWVSRPLQPRSGHKREALYPEPPMRMLHVRPSSASPPLLFFLQLALATLPLAHLSHQFHSLPSELPSIFVHAVEKKLGSRPEEGLKPSGHPWLSPWKRSRCFARCW
jgi:hypothetical protein